MKSAVRGQAEWEASKARPGLGDAVYHAKVTALAEAALADDVPAIQQLGQSVAVQTASANPVGYTDAPGYQTQFGPEVAATAEVEGLLDEGQRFVHMLYTYRSVSRAIPVSLPDDAEAPAQKRERDEKSFNVLRREIKKLRELMDFARRALHVFDKNLRHLCETTSSAGSKMVPDGYYFALTRCIDLLQKLDNLKDTKASLKNDLSRYRRLLKSLQDPAHDVQLNDAKALADEACEHASAAANVEQPDQLLARHR